MVLILWEFVSMSIMLDKLEDGVAWYGFGLCHLG